MPYQSPLHILDSLQIQPDDLTPVTLNQLRKKILAEFNLKNEVTITIGKQQYTKDEVLKAIDRLKDVEHLNSHSLIFKNKPLLTWLENPGRISFPAQTVSNLRWSGQQDEFYLNVMQEALREHLHLLLKTRRFRQAEKPLETAFSLPEYGQYDIRVLIFEHLYDVISLIGEAYEAPDYARDVATFGFITDPAWTDFLNNLPDEFEGAINDYCVKAINYTVAIQHKQQEFVYEISSQLVQTRCDESLKFTIQQNHNIYDGKYNGATNNTGSSISWRTIWVIIWILITVVRACT